MPKRREEPMGSEAFDPKVALDFMAGRRQCWGCGHKVSGDNFTHRYRFSDEKARPKLPLCPLLVEIERMACIMGVSIERFDTGRIMLCGFHAHHHMLGGGTSIYPHHCCLETISQFEKMIAFVQSPDANAERSQNAINARSLFESFTDERVSAALALRQKVRLREECQERLSY